MFCWEAINYYLKRLTGAKSQDSLASVAAKCIEIAPPEIRPNRPTIMLPGILQRIKAYCPDTTVELEQERLGTNSRKHGGTYAYLLKDAIMLDGTLFADGMGMHLLPKRRHRLWANLSHLSGEFALASSLYGNIYWGHWLLDDCPKYFLAEQYGECVTPLRAKYGHQADYERLMGMKLREINAVKFESLWVFDDYGQNSSKAARFSQMREALLQAINMPSPASHTGVYLTRGMAGARRYLVNEPEVAEFMAARGFRVLDPMKSSVEEILRASAGAKIVAGVEGSGLAHAIALMAPESTLMVINPPNRFNNVYKDMTDCMNTNYAVVMGILSGEDFYA
ncbi:MAG TPA: glycosyltransferase family 61 protein, partial [Pseudomonadales bacterium]|nr:glycosyltransferase family 61 protein [Pseudomonadales bacterium]